MTLEIGDLAYIPQGYTPEAFLANPQKDSKSFPPVIHEPALIMILGTFMGVTRPRFFKILYKDQVFLIHYSTPLIKVGKQT